MQAAAAPMGTNFDASPQASPGVKQKFEELRDSGTQFFSSMAAKVKDVDPQEVLMRFMEALGRLINWIKQACLALLGVRRKPQEAGAEQDAGAQALGAAPAAPLPSPGIPGTTGFQFGQAPQSTAVPVMDQWEDGGKAKPGFVPTPHPDTGVEDVHYRERHEPASSTPQLGKPRYLLGADGPAAVEDAATLAALDAIQTQLKSPQAGEVVAELLDQGRVSDAVSSLLAPAAEAFSRQAAAIRATLAQDLDQLLHADVPDVTLRQAGIHEVLAGLPTLGGHATFDDAIQARIAAHLQTRLADVHHLVLYRVAQGGLSNLLVGFQEAAPVQAPPQLHTRFTFHRDGGATPPTETDDAGGSSSMRPKA